MLKPRYKEESSEGLPKGVNGKEIREYYEKNLIDPESMKELASNNLPKGYLK